jgi:hypothetical protein
MDSCTVEALELIAASTPIVFTTMHVGHLMNSQHKFICIARTGEEICARVSTIIRVVTSASDLTERTVTMVDEISQMTEVHHLAD